MLLVGVDFPVAAGGSTYIENFGAALNEAGVPTEVLSIYPGTQQTSLLHRVVFKRKGLQASPVIGDDAVVSNLRLLPIVAFKRIDRFVSLRRTRRYLSTFGPESLIIFTHVKALIALKESGYSPALSQALLIGQHHSPYISLRDEQWLLQALPEHFSDLKAFTALSVPDAMEFESLIGIPSYGLPNPSRPPTQLSDAPLLKRSKRVVALARYSKEKRLDLMIEAFATAMQRHALHDWRLEIYGEGPEASRLEKVIRLKGAEGFVSLEGRHDNVDSILADSQLNVLSSDYEGFGLSILEAGTQGVPSVSFASSPGVSELVKSLGGRLVPPGDVQALSEEIAMVLRNSPLRAQLGKAASIGSSEYSGPQLVERWGHLLCSLGHK